MWGYIWSKWMLGCAPDLWSLVGLLKLTWFHLGAQTPIWSDLETCTLSPHFRSCWGPSALKPERNLRGGGEAVSRIPNLITHLLKWCPPAAQSAQAPTAQKLRSLLEHFYAQNKPTVPTLWRARTSRKSGFAVCSFNLTINCNREGKKNISDSSLICGIRIQDWSLMLCLFSLCFGTFLKLIQINSL